MFAKFRAIVALAGRILSEPLKDLTLENPYISILLSRIYGDQIIQTRSMRDGHAAWYDHSIVISRLWFRRLSRGGFRK